MQVQSRQANFLLFVWPVQLECKHGCCHEFYLSQQLVLVHKLKPAQKQHSKFIANKISSVKILTKSHPFYV